MNAALSINRSAAVAVKLRIMRANYSPVFDALTMHITQGDIGNSGPRRKCENF